LILVLAIDAWVRRVPVVVGAIWFLPLLILIPGMARDRLRSVAWMSFVTLMYFVSGVQRVFAEPESLRAVAELSSVIALFLCSMLYIRQRGRELRASTDTPPAAEE
jgi:uncharacterized membrane protein